MNPTNFDYLSADPGFSSFADTAISAEKIYSIDTSACVVNCRRALEFAVKWLYSVDSSLVLPYQDNLATLINTEEFKKLIGYDLRKRISFIRVLGNNAAHGSAQFTPDQAELALENLFIFLDFIAYCYSPAYKPRTFDRTLLKNQDTTLPALKEETPLIQLIDENKPLKNDLTARRTEREPSYLTKPLEISEYKTRKIYIDTQLIDAGWEKGKDWLDEYELPGMPNRGGVGYADYVLFGSDGRPLAIIEAKKTCKDPAVGRQQAKLYADLLEQKFGKRPVIFLTNGFETRIWNDTKYPERKVSGIYAKRDLEKEFAKLAFRTSLENIQINTSISGRYYQIEAIKAVCRAFDTENRRKALLVMATGSGKTRTVISLVDILIRHGWAKNILFLADRNLLVTQAKRSFNALLPDLSLTNLSEEKDSLNARAVFSTYQTMINAIDDIKDENGGRLFTCGHFDLIIIDEAHRSIYNKYKDIFSYFDAHLIGLTATPKDEVDKNTYDTFELESGVPTYGYDLSEAVSDGYLVDFVTIETKLKFIEEGIIYDDLTDEEKEEYEKDFTSEDGEVPESINSAALNEWIFNTDTIRQVLAIVMKNSLKTDFGSNIGKTIIFAKNHHHAEKIYEIFGREYPNYPPNYCRVIDNYTNYAQSLVDEFSNPNKLPRIAISVDMLDTGLDVPEIQNLVFFKKVYSKGKFWQMIGRGTRLCPGLIDGADKNQFYIFDFCGNFEFFRVMKKGKEAPLQTSVQERIFNLECEMAFKLQALEYQTDELIPFRQSLVDDLAGKIRELNRDNFAVKQHLKYIDQYASKEAFRTLTYEKTLLLAEEIAPLILPYKDEASAVRFDALIYGLELAFLAGNKYKKATRDLNKKVRAIADISTIPEILAQRELIQKILHTDYVKEAGIKEFENIRTNLRGLMKYILLDEITRYDTNFSDKIVDTRWAVSELDDGSLQNYKAKAEFYLRQHQDEDVIAKLKSNIPLTSEDVKELEKILWKEVGSKKEYEKEIGDKPLGVFVREIIGLDMKSAKEAFAKYLNETDLDSRQIYFVNRIVEYIVRNGLMPDLSVLQTSPFTDKGSVVEIFTDLSMWNGIRQVIDKINSNAMIA
ncbi:MAG: DEAD/DEAH box helicase family protein [Methanocorpusculum sp.]|nr:DEAD/DEAH box helicase family protein [Methanocorpusculum sp.]